MTRWLLVLLLAFDQLSAPFHHHRHEGAGGPHEFAAAHDTFKLGDTHAEGENPPPVSHAVMAIRAEPLQLAQLPANSGVDFQGALPAVVATLAASDQPLTAYLRPDRSAPEIRSHRSLPPPGRAPPLHA